MRRPSVFALAPLIALAITLAQPVLAQQPPAIGMTEGPQPPLVADPPRLPDVPGAETGVNLAEQTDAAAAADPVAAAPLPAEPTDLVSIVMRAHWVVKSVMAGLAAMAFVVLTVMLYKSVEIARSTRRLGQSFRLLAGEATLGGLSARLPAAPEAGAAMVRLVEDELAALPDAIGAIEAEGLRERCRIGLARIEAVSLHSLRAGVGLLAQVAATAPFIGLFGTVFGIMNAFLAIAATKTTNLAVVAPGIAEALLATAVGLAAAIPAVLVYNLLTRRIAVFRHRLGDVAALTERRLSSEIDRRRLRLIAGSGA